jgi:CubicO group peptidase (beta-lactamase class C family)
MKKPFLFIIFLVYALATVAQHNLDPVLNAPGVFPKQKEQFLLNQGNRFVPIPVNSEATNVKVPDNTLPPGTIQRSYLSPSFDPTWANRFQTVLDSIRIANNMKGASLAVFVPGQGLMTCVTGISSPGVPVTTAMRFGIMSNTKLFIASTLARLEEQGVLSLDDHLYQWLPSHQNVDSSTTIRQLLSHQSGIWDYWNDGDSLWNQVWVDTSRFWLPEEMLAYIKAPHFPPGHGYRYSNTNFLLAGMVIDAATGTTWLQKIHDVIINPLNMDSTFAGAYEPRNGPVAAEYLYNTPAILSPITAEFTQGNAAAALLSTAQEMAEWYSSLFSGVVVNGSSLQQITDFDPTSYYGLGLGLYLYKNHPAYNHTGGGAGYLSLAWYDAVTRSTLCLLMNDRNYGTFDSRAVPLLDVLLDEYPRKTNDAGITGINSPWEHSCGATRIPSVLLTNFGNTILASVNINYQVDTGTPASYAWTGSLSKGDTVEVNLPQITTGNGFHTFTCYTNLPNGAPEGYNYNDTTRSTFITDILPPAISVIDESFESTVFPPEGWTQNSNSFLNWGSTLLAQFSGSRSAVLNNYTNNMVGSNYDLNLPMIRVAAGTHPSLEFEYAYALSPGSFGDSLQVNISRDCGSTWQMIFDKGGSTLATSAPTLYPFYPQSTAEWKHESISLESDTGNVLIRFRDVCGWGNNLYLDDVRVSFPTGMADIKPQNTIIVSPNPATDNITISGMPANAEIQITDLTGKLLVTVKASNNVTTIDISRFPQGVFILRSPLVVKKIVKM